MAIAYLVSRYPAVSHTFVRREVVALRRRGLEIQTFSLRETPGDQILSPEDEAERQGTWSILPTSPRKLAWAHMTALWRRPRQYFSTLRKAMQHRIPGVRSALWATFHFAEAILLARELESRGIRHLHSHFSNAGGEVGRLASAYSGLGWSLTLHGSADFDSPTSGLLGEKVADAQFVACVSHFGRAQALKLSAPEHWERVVVVRCGVPLADIPFRRNRTSSNRLRVLSVGRLAPEKGFVGLVDAFAEVLRDGVDAELRILGEGSERRNIERRIAEHNLGARVSLPGHVPESQVLEELRAADVFAMSSFVEGLPVVLMESLAVGVPAVAPQLAGIPELIEHGRCGLLYHPARFEQLAEQLKRILRDQDLRQRFAEAGRRRIEEEFDIERAVEPLVGIYGELLGVAATIEGCAAHA